MTVTIGRDVAQAAAILRRGGLVAFPTETVYGLGADARNADAVRNRLRAFCPGEKTLVEALLYCPDYTVKSPGTAGIDPARIVDAPKRDQLMKVIREILPATVGPGIEKFPRERILRFFGEMLELVPEVHAVVGEAGLLYTRLSGGLAEWARRIEFEPFRLRVIGTEIGRAHV